MATRERFSPQSEHAQREILAKGVVTISHPTVGQPLFCFPAFSQPDPAFPNDSSKTLFGVCHRLALDACRVVTNYATKDWEDFVSLDRGGKTPIPIDDAKPLSPGVYYYSLGPLGESVISNCPIVKKFSRLKFPSQLPNNWYSARRSFKGDLGGIKKVSATEMSSYVSERDKYCILSGWTHCAFFYVALMQLMIIVRITIIVNRSAHLIPKANRVWFDANHMYYYSVENVSAGVNAHTNSTLLCDDVHRCFESGCFVFYPAGDGDKFMAYFMDLGGCPDYTEQFHRRLASIHDCVPAEFIYARFAHTIIRCLLPPWAFDEVPDNEISKLTEYSAQETSAKTSEDSQVSGRNPNEESDVRVCGYFCAILMCSPTFIPDNL